MVFDLGAEAVSREGIAKIECVNALFGRVPQHFSASLLRTAQLKPGQRVLDVTTGTGLVAEAIANTIGPAGHLIGVDISRAMLARAERRLERFPQVSLEVGDGQALRFETEQFDTVICSLALMLFADPARGTAEMQPPDR
jgi:ubiquinone/menaquinone biosynthesis C-methylase UbiE